MQTATMTFKEQILEGIPSQLPNAKPYDVTINHAPKRKAILSLIEQRLALRNALRYFEQSITLNYFRNSRMS